MTIDPSTRCPWCGNDPLYVAYHDTQWGVPEHDDRALFESLILDGFQAGLSWLTILRKRENFRRAFAGFDAAAIARFTEQDAARLMQDKGIVRNRLKIRAAVGNAQAFLDLVESQGSFDAYLWRFVDGTPLQNHWTTLETVPAHTALSDKLARDLKQRGFKFVGTTIMYAFMQAVGMVNDHLVNCPRHAAVAAMT